MSPTSLGNSLLHITPKAKIQEQADHTKEGQKCWPPPSSLSFLK